MSEEHSWQEQFGQPATRLEAWLRRHRLTGVAETFLEAIEPLALVGAQVLHTAHPALSMVIKAQTIKEWARLLETPGGLAWLREQLTNPPSEPPDTRADNTHGSA